LNGNKLDEQNRVERQQTGESFFGIYQFPLYRLLKASNLSPSPHPKSLEVTKSAGSADAWIGIVPSWSSAPLLSFTEQEKRPFFLLSISCVILG
jgi:hypothetical protein